MKKILLFFFTLSFTFGFAQDWAPFKTSDTLRHFIADNTTSPYSSFRPIQSLLADTSFIDSNNNTVIIFRIGFSALELFKNSLTSTKVIAKGTILGDTAIINSDSSIYKSRDSLGFRLVFPHQYKLNSTWDFGSSVDYSLVANCDSIYQDSALTNLDSIAKISIKVYDSNNNLDTSHHFNASFNITKHYGFNRTIDFTGLQKTFRYQAFVWDNITTKNKSHDLTIGDEYHFYKSYYGNNYPFYGTHTYNTLVIADSTAGNKRFISYLTIEQDRPPVPGTYNTPILYDTLNIQFDTNSTFCFNHSALIQEVSQGNFIYPVFGLINSRTFNQLIRFQTTNIIPYAKNFQNLNALHDVDSLELLFFEGKELYKEIIGITDEYDVSNTSTSPSSKSKDLLYIKKGTQTWGNPLDLLVGLKHLSNTTKDLNIYPNPTTGELSISSSKDLNSIQLYSTQGQKVIELRPHNNEAIQLNIEGPAGIYFLRLLMNDGSIRSSKVLKK